MQQALASHFIFASSSMKNPTFETSSGRNMRAIVRGPIDGFQEWGSWLHNKRMFGLARLVEAVGIDYFPKGERMLAANPPAVIRHLFFAKLELNPNHLNLQ